MTTTTFRRMLGSMALVAATPAMAQDGSASRRVADMIACRVIVDNAARLACFDKAAAATSVAQSSGELLVLDRKKVVANKRAQFGLTQPTAEILGGGADKATEVKQLDTTIRIAKPATSTGRWNMQLADGSVWQTIDPVPFPPETGASIIVRQATLGGYRATIAKGRSILVKRLR